MSSKELDNHVDTIFNTKKSVKWLEVPIQKFNTAVPHFVDQLKTHQNNIQKLRRLEQWEDIKKENISANQIINQLTSLLYEMENLRNQVIETDLKKFDKLINNSKQNASIAIISFQDVSSKLRLSKSNQMVENLEEDEVRSLQEEQLVVVADLSEAIKVEEHRAAAMDKLHEDIEDVNYIFQELSHLVHEQGEAVEQIETHVETTHHNIMQGEKMLLQAAKYKNSAYPLLGALIGSIMGGPVGLVAGFKLGGLTATALGCGFLGFTGGKMLKGLDTGTIEAAERHLENHS